MSCRKLFMIHPMAQLLLNLQSCDWSMGACGHLLPTPFNWHQCWQTCQGAALSLHFLTLATSQWHAANSVCRLVCLSACALTILSTALSSADSDAENESNARSNREQHAIPADGKLSMRQLCLQTVVQWFRVQGRNYACHSVSVPPRSSAASYGPQWEHAVVCCQIPTLF